MKDQRPQGCAAALENDGRVWFREAVVDEDLALLDSACRLKHTPGLRLAWSDELSAVAGTGSRLTTLARRLLPGARPVRLLLFDKTSDVNWQLPWHQDRVIAVRGRHAVNGFTSWTRKAGVWHVEPPLDFLRRMIFARVHLDDTDAQNGCLELALGSHKLGRVRTEDAADAAASAPQEVCSARRGDILFVKALTLHRSGRSADGSQRRTLRIDYCAESLPPPLAWAF